MNSLKNLEILELVGNPNLSVMPGTFLKLELKHLSLSSRCLILEASATTITHIFKNTKPDRLVPGKFDTIWIQIKN